MNEHLLERLDLYISVNAEATSCSLVLLIPCFIVLISVKKKQARKRRLTK